MYRDLQQEEKRIRLIQYLLNETPEYGAMTIPAGAEEQKRLLRSLVNVRPPGPVAEEVLDLEDSYLREENRQRGYVTLQETTDYGNHLYLWQGDITCLQVGAIVNAANSGMTGCYQPCHNCIDNCIHTYAGIRLRNHCDSMMRSLAKNNGGFYQEPTGLAKLTPAYNLPAEYVIHTVGPIVQGALTAEHEMLLAGCYRNCLDVAENNHIASIAFCCISTGVFMFPNQRAAEIAVETVTQWQRETGSEMDIVFNVFKDVDWMIYEELLNDI